MYRQAVKVSLCTMNITRVASCPRLYHFLACNIEELGVVWEWCSLICLTSSQKIPSGTLEGPGRLPQLHVYISAVLLCIQAFIQMCLIVSCAPLQVLCAAAVNPVMFLEDNRNAVAVLKSATPLPDAKPDNFSTSLIWVVSGATSLTKVTH